MFSKGRFQGVHIDPGFLSVFPRMNVLRPLARRLGTMALMASVTGPLMACHDSGPVAWLHHLEGGHIAQNVPPPPGANDPFPNFSMIPPPPVLPDRAARQREMTELLAQRDQAVNSIAADPVPEIPKRPNVPRTAGNAADLTTGHFDAAQGAAQDAVQPAAPSPAPAQTTATPDPASTPRDSSPGATASALPTMPDAPPAPPVLPGQPLPSQTARQTTHANDPTDAPPSRPQATPSTVTIGFAEGSAKLPVSAHAAIQALAMRRGAHMVQVTGYGESRPGTPVAQESALELGWERASALADALTNAGVPRASIVPAAQAAGRGGAIRLLD